MQISHFFSIISRMKYINRWGLMRNTRQENISEHSLEVSMLAHALVIIKNRRFGSNLSAERAAVLGLYHDTSEILTGDLPTPVKYYNPKIKQAYKEVETVASQKLLSYLPDDLREDFIPLLVPDPEENELWAIVKAADKISALIKCIEEQKAGNTEFSKAGEAIRNAIDLLNCPAANVFLEEFLPSYALTLDEQDNE